MTDCNTCATRRALHEFLFKVHGMHRWLFIAAMIWAALYVSSSEFWQHPMLHGPPPQRQPASQANTFVLNKALLSSSNKNGPGRVYLDMDPDAVAYFDSESPDSSRGHRVGELLPLTTGAHSVIVYKPDYPPVAAEIDIFTGSTTVLSARLLAY